MLAEGEKAVTQAGGGLGRRGRNFCYKRVEINSFPLIFASPFETAQVAKLVDALSSGGSAARCAGSNPVLGTSLESPELSGDFFIYGLGEAFGRMSFIIHAVEPKVGIFSLPVNPTESQDHAAAILHNYHLFLTAAGLVPKNNLKARLNEDSLS